MREALEARSGLSPEQIDTLCAFGQALIEKNKVMNLTAITEPQAVAELHFLDCIALLRAEDFFGKRVIDIGCGAGFPGVPLKIAEPSIELTLLDSLAKRMTWLREILPQLGVEAEVVTARAEEFVQTRREQYDIATSRAVARLNILAELCLPYVKVGGAFLAMKGALAGEEMEEAKRAVALLGGMIEQVYEYPFRTRCIRLLSSAKSGPRRRNTPARSRKSKKVRCRPASARQEGAGRMDILSLCRRMVMLFFCMACGFCAAKGGVMDTQSNKKLSALVVNVANPMQILASALTGERLLSTGQTLRLAGLIALIYLALIALSFPAVRLLRVRDAERGLYRFMFIFSNTGFLGYPVVESLLGSGAAFYVTIFVLFFQLFCWSYGASLMRGAARFRFQWKVLRQPCVAASLAAFAVYLSGWQPPALLHQTVKYVGDITSPVVMLIVGCSLAQMRFKQIFGSWRIYALSALKLAAVPLLAYAVLRHVLTNEFALCVLTVLLCMPIATNTTILSYQYGADETAASSGVFVSTLLSLLTIPLMMKLLFGT